ncbi:MAG TPA: phosphate ABC transporter permease PstA [Acidiphilium sp.]|jgi:phosphate transport system permease protein|uniref:phosphate ABC transporter permease PstA n=1 Tax=unclassified Acidiphilium TaxID=2617493 RepID=UPI000BD4B8C8|nr:MULTISPECIES: phosphate ABC transporter permease PstA [unclassified Acidiphilium]OYV57655.1 MAG: phosphate ABC transporter, permease protein PstA [Acidiphilium sp. 20-67-58]HQT62153.1 phosphate ABC transporter permease PstA [Acidiphilium sp.]HQU12020.1 phosphate ABC transporter permease PstA [Acidiphilium sp.]
MSATHDATPARLTTLERRRYATNIIGWGLCTLAFLLIAVPLLDLVLTVTLKGASAFSVALFTTSTNGVTGGLQNAIIGTLVLSLGSLLIAAPIGIGAGIYLSEYGANRFGATVRFLADTLTGTPSIVLGYFSYITMVIGLGWKFSALAGAITLAIMVVPYLARITEMSLRRVPISMREAAYALGARDHTVASRIVLAAAAPGVITGVLLSLAISVGETAPLIYTAGWSNYLWSGKLTNEPIGYLTYVIWTFINEPNPQSHALAFAAALLVMLVVLAINIGVRMILRRDP